MVLLGDEAKWMFVLVYMEIVLILTQDRGTICVECTIDSEIILDAPDGNRSIPGSYGILFRSVWRQC